MNERLRAFPRAAVRALGFDLPWPLLRGLVGVLLVYFAMSIASIFMLPKYVPADEPRHIAYSLALAKGRWPKMADPLPFEELQTGRLKSGNVIAAAKHPPLFYWLTAPTLAHAAKHGQMDAGVRNTRYIVMLLGAACIVYVLRIARRLVPERPAVALLVAAIFGTMPVFINSCSIVYNDALGILVSLGSFHAALAAWQDGPTRKRLLIAGLWMTVALFSRITTAFVVGPAALLTVLAVAHRSEGSLPKRLGRAALVGLAITAAIGLVSGWFYLRNYQFYGDFTGAKEALRLFGRKPHGEAEDLILSGGSWSRLHEHLWVRLAGHVYLRGTAELLVDVVAAAPLLLLPKLAVDARRSILPFLRSRQALAWGMSILAFVCVVVPMFIYHSRGGNLNARYLIPVVWLPLLVLAAALSSTRSPAPAQWGIASFLLVSYVTLELYARALTKLRSAEVALPHAFKATGVRSPEIMHLAVFAAIALGAALVVGAIGELHRRFVDDGTPPGPSGEGGDAPTEPSPEPSPEPSVAPSETAQEETA